MFSTTLPVRRLATFFAAIAFISAAINGFANPAPDVLNETDIPVQKIPRMIDGYHVVTEVTGSVRAFGSPL
jgi:hypothetical protein